MAINRKVGSHISLALSLSLVSKKKQDNDDKRFKISYCG